MTKVDEAKYVLATVSEKLSRIEEYVQSFDRQNGSISRLKARQQILEGIRKEFEETQYQLESLDGKSEDAKQRNRAARIRFENSYCDIMGDIIDIIQSAEKVERDAQFARSSMSTSAAATPTPLSNARDVLPTLPVLQLNTFSGSYKDWTNFENCFKSAIDENHSLNNRQKLQYLKSCLREEALRAIESLSIEDENYKKSWEILEKRFKNTRLIVQDHVSSILNATAVTKSSGSLLRELLDIIITNIAALKTLKLPVESWDALIVPIITEKLDFNSKKEWQGCLNTAIPSYEQLIDFLERRCIILESLNTLVNKTTNHVNNLPKPAYSKRTITNVAAVSDRKRNLCLYCKSDKHMIHHCPEFINLSTSSKLEKVDFLKLCVNCLRNNHTVQNCRVTKGCRTCNGKHHTLVHTQGDNTTHTHKQTTINNHALHKMSQTNNVLLATAIILIKDKRNQYQTCRVLLDPGSMSNCITRESCKRLGLKATNENYEIKGVNGATSTASQSVIINIKSKHNPYEANNIKCIIVEKITENLPLVPINPSNLNIPSNIILADPKFFETSRIDVLIGGGLFWSLLCVGQISLSTGLVLQKTHFGFIAAGPYRETSNNSVINTVCCNTALTVGKTLEDQVAKFWEIESSGINPPETNSCLSAEELQCERFFQLNTKRDINGAFVVKLPKMENTINVGESKSQAVKRFYNLERKFVNNEKLKLAYSNFINEYLRLGHMQEIKTAPLQNTVYLPHHAVHKESSTTTKLRVVFDASAKTSNGTSLNDHLLRGPVIQRDLFSIILEFRTFQYALNADITKMYRQIRVHEDDVNYQLIVWRDDPNQPLQTYQLVTLTYGTKPASFIATRCLTELATLNTKKYPKAAQIIRKNFYMDDLLTGADSVEELIQIRDDIVSILNQGQFELRKFNSNDQRVLLKGSNSDIERTVDLNKNEDSKVLGLSWNAEADILKYHLNLSALPKKVTKRIILSISSQIFDPLGLIGPVMMKAKIILQQLWSLKLGWDESVPMSVHTAFTVFLAELDYLKNITIPRKVKSEPSAVDVEIHGFCDASQQGYGAALYVRSTTNGKNYETNLLCSKSRVAPLKTITLPRLELCGAVLLARLIAKVRQNITVSSVREVLWTDSSIVLAWINTPANALKTFVGNRVAEITTLTAPKSWRHVRSEQNAADLLSRGGSPADVVNNTTWFKGPKFLSVKEDQWPQSHLNIIPKEIPEKRSTFLLGTTIATPEILLSKFSNFDKLQRVVAWMLRFINNCKNNCENKTKTNTLSASELNNATLIICRVVQKVEFNEEWTCLSRGKTLPNNSKILSLNPFFDQNMLIRVGGRLKNAAISNDTKFPILLPKTSTISKLVIKQEHERQLHAGPQATLAALRQRFWVVSARSVIRHVLHQCHACFKTNPTKAKFKMGDLPAPRVQPARPFLTTGVDYAGPIQIKESRGRGKRFFKGYIVLFVCFATKAVHIELVTDLSTEEFLAAFRRFMSRRGYPRNIYSDNGTNFIGAKNELKELFAFIKQNNDHFINSLTSHNTSWHLIPPKSPHMGGLWEANVKCMKRHLKKITGNTHLTITEMYTLLVRIEACLNSRPLIPLSSDPNDLQVLTPGHFLIGEPLTAIPEYDLQEVPINRLSRWQLVERLRSHYWRRWTREYLTTLQNRAKWFRDEPVQIRKGAMVMLVEDNLPPLSWKIGRIQDIHPGDDGRVRVVSVKTAQGVVKRALRKVCPLPTED